MTLTPEQRSEIIKTLRGKAYPELCAWLCDNFSPERYRAGASDAVAGACQMLFSVHNPHGNAALTTEFIARLWGTHGQLPDDVYNIDSYGRLTSIVPNYAKDGVRERVKAMVDQIEPSEKDLERWGRL